MLFTLLICLFRVRAKLSSGEISVRGDQWPMLVYADQEYDPEHPWEGLFRSQILVWVSMHLPSSSAFIIAYSCAGIQAHLYLAQFSGKRSEGDKIGQRAYPWDDSGHYRLPGLCSYTGVSTVNTVNALLIV
jgi:hypothetical protein